MTPLNSQKATAASIMATLPVPSSNAAANLNNLSDDCTFLIIEAVRNLGFKRTKEIGIYKGPLKSLSLVNKRLRTLCTPSIFDLRRLAVSIRPEFPDVSEGGILVHLAALRRSLFAGPLLQTLVVTFDECNYNYATKTMSIVPSTTRLGEALVETLQLVGNIRELQIAGMRTLSTRAKGELQTTGLNRVETLVVKDIPEAALFIHACPNLTTFKSNFPFKKPKATVNAIKASDIDKIELDNHTGWKYSQLKELSGCLGKIRHLRLKGQVRATVPQLMPALRSLENIQTFAIATEPWVNSSRYCLPNVDPQQSHFYRFMAKIGSNLNQTSDEMIMRSVFNQFKSAKTAWVIFMWHDPAQYGVVRNEDGSVAAIIAQDLQPTMQECAPSGWSSF